MKDFYYRQGGYLAILHLFRSKDFHYENIIAHGSHPVLIDLETLLDNDIEFQFQHELIENTFSDISESIISSGMLPFHVKGKDGIEFDFSALGRVEEGQKSSFASMDVLYNYNSDDVSLEKKPMTAGGKSNVPLLNNEPAYSNEYIEEIEEGFRELYFFFLKNRKNLVADNGPIKKNSNIELRHVLRSTNLYSRFLRMSTYPKYLTNGLNRNRLFDILFNDVRNENKYYDFVQFECRDLLKHDIPYFKFRPNSKDIITSDGSVITNFYRRTSLDLVMERCLKLSFEDCKRQQQYIRMSLSTLETDNINALNKPYPDFNKNQINSSLSEFLEEAKRIGDQILEHLIDKDNLNVMGLVMDDFGEKKVSFRPFDSGLYDGLAGISLFLAQLGRELNDPKYVNVSRQVFELCVDITEFNRFKYKDISAFSGLGSIAYTAAYLGSLWGDDNYVETSLKYLRLAKEEIGESHLPDLVAGEAGVLIVCLRIYKRFNRVEALDIAKEFGEYIYNFLIKELNKDTPDLLTGYSHGASGYAWSLYVLGNKINNNDYINLADKLLEYENQYYCEINKNWADLRNKNNTIYSSTYWCHGAPGIGLSRVNIMAEQGHSPYSIYERDLKNSIATTLNKGFKANHSICHGDLGNLEILLIISNYLQDEMLKTQVHHLGLNILEQSRAIGWKDGTDGASEMYGFMVGNSGIGFEMLRLWNSNLPSVLNLELEEKEVEPF